ncbi:hypothetical protein B0H19DRAFT_651907 [Mycena capillaripes]|nr:hypothetical protein B0H19DRAFT_651907 [Mycena capillaripes]
MSSSCSPPPSKRVKIESPATPVQIFKSEPDEPLLEPQELEDEDEDRCSICLQEIIDRTVVPICAHEFCFDCLLVWTGQSRRCPLCSQGIGPFLIHKIRSRFDYQKHYLNPLPTTTSPVPLRPLPLLQTRPARRRPRDRAWGRRETTDADEADKLERSIAKRRWIYEHDLYAKHVASNAYTRYRPYPTPAQFAASPELISRTIMFLRRELQVWVNLDVEFLTTFIISIMKALDIRSESAVKLLSEFLDLDAPYVEGGRHVNAEHFAHEVYSYVRSPYKDLFVYDSVVQYEVTAEVPSLAEEPRRRWREPSRSRSPVGSARDARGEGTRRIRSRSRSRSLSSSGSGRWRRSRDRQLDEHTSRGSGRGRRQLRNASRHRSNERPKTSANFDIDAERTAPGRIQYDQPETLPPTPDAATETTETLNLKGKARSIPGALSSEEEISKAPTPKEEIAAEVPVPLVENLRKPQRVRNRSLFESVQAHLAGPSRKQREPETLHDSAAGSSKPSLALNQENTGSVPSLLTRLSDPGTQQNIRQKPDSLSPGNGAKARIIEAAASEIPVEKELLPSFSAPEIMARTRARFAKLAASDDFSSQQSLSIDGGVGTARPPSSSAPLSLGSRQDGNSDISTSPGKIGETPRRAKLLGRLEEEKQKACGVAGSQSIVEPTEVALNVALDRISQGAHPIAFPVDVTASGNFPPTSADAAEARLRRQAQLRVRLAAEKRKHARTD